ncbi:MAG: hypothetical protein AAF526_00500 [Pseudomonadota bacterium]
MEHNFYQSAFLHVHREDVHRFEVPTPQGLAIRKEYCGWNSQKTLWKVFYRIEIEGRVDSNINTIITNNLSNGAHLSKYLESIEESEVKKYFVIEANLENVIQIYISDESLDYLNLFSLKIYIRNRIPK